MRVIELCAWYSFIHLLFIYHHEDKTYRHISNTCILNLQMQWRVIKIIIEMKYHKNQ